MANVLKMIAEMGLNIAPFQAGLKKAEGAAQQAGHSILSTTKGLVASYFGVSALQSLIGKTFERAKEIKYAALQFQITTDEVQNLGRAAGKTGLEFEDFGTALSKLGSARQDAAEGNRELRESFLKYGITLETLQDPTMRNIDLMKKMASAINGVNGMTQKDRQNFRDFFGRSGDRLIESLRLFQEDKSKIISREDVDEIYRAEKAMKLLRKQWEIFASRPIGLGASAIAIAMGASPTDISFDDVESPDERAKRLSLLKKISNRSKGIVEKTPDQLYKDKAAQEELKDAKKAQYDYEKAISDVVFGRLSNSSKILALEDRRNELQSEMLENEKRFQAGEITGAVFGRKRSEMQQEDADILGKMLGLKKENVGLQSVAASRGGAAAIGVGYGADPIMKLFTVNGKQLKTQEEMREFLREIYKSQSNQKQIKFAQ